MKPAIILPLLLLTIHCSQKGIPDTAAMEMITILQPGKTASFARGSTLYANERPVHPLTLCMPYEIGKYEVTNAQFAFVFNRALKEKKVRLIDGDLWDAAGTRKFLSLKNAAAEQAPLILRNGRLVPNRIYDPHKKARVCTADFPVSSVSWYGACKFCNLLSEIEGLDAAYNEDSFECDRSKGGYRLPTEAEWLFAAKGTRERLYAWGNESPQGRCSWHSEGTDTLKAGGPAAAGHFGDKSASFFGVMDMCGNLREWCNDRYTEQWFRYSPPRDPEGPAENDSRFSAKELSTRVLKGGGFDSPADDLRLEARANEDPAHFNPDTGFRVVRTLR